MDWYRRVIAYLDTSDWAYLEEGRAAEAEKRLRAQGERGALFLLSFEHLLEVAGLSAGRRDRLAYLREFPGAMLARCSGVQMLKFSTTNFVRASLDVPGLSIDGELVPLTRHTTTEWMELVDRFVLLRALQGRSAKLVAGAPRRKESREQRDVRLKTLRLARKGDIEELISYVSRKGSTARPLVKQVALRALVVLQRWVDRKGYAIPCDKREEAFETLVVGSVPKQLRTSKEVMRRLRERWADREFVADIAPALACVANLSSRLEVSAEPDKVRSDENDRHHAAFAPMVDVFTCDKRNHALIRETLGKVRPQIAVLRTGQLGQVVEELEQRLCA